MNLVPDWAPNIHPLLVHFPIALLSTAAAVRRRGLGVSSQQAASPVGHAAVCARHGSGGGGVCDRPRGLSDDLVSGDGAGGSWGALGLGVSDVSVLWDGHRDSPVPLAAIAARPGPAIVARDGLVGLVGIGLLGRNR